MRESKQALGEVRNLCITKNRIATALDRLTISIEEEGLDVIKQSLRILFPFR